MRLVFDIGGTNMRVAASSDGTTIKKSKIVSTPQDFEQGIQTLKQIADELSEGERIDKVAGGVAGPLDHEKTMLVAGPHMGAWVQKPLKISLEETFNLPVILEHEADLQGLAEATLGAGVGYKIVANINIGTGIASTRIVDGKIDEKSQAFEAGHQIIVPDGNLCDCGGKGHLEAYVSGSGIEKTYGKKGEEITDAGVWDEVARYLAIGLNNVTVLWSPGVVVLGGAVAKSIPLDKVKMYLKDFLFIFPKPPEIIPAKLGDSAGLLGALLISQS